MIVRRGYLGFTLLELLLAIGLASLLIGLAGPALVGLLRAPGMRGAAATVMATLEEARARAVARGGGVRVAFVGADAPRVEDRYRRFVLLEEDPASPDRMPRPCSAVGRLPEGISFLHGNGARTVYDGPSLGPIALPSLGGGASVVSVRFGAAGEIDDDDPAGGEVRVVLFEGEMIDGVARFRGGHPRVEIVEISRLTGLTRRGEVGGGAP